MQRTLHIVVVTVVLLSLASLSASVDSGRKRHVHRHSGTRNSHHRSASGNPSRSRAASSVSASYESTANAEFFSALVKDKDEMEYAMSIEKLTKGENATDEMKDLWSSYKGMKEYYFPLMRTYIAENRGFWANKLKTGGTLSNLETGLVWLFTLGKGTEMKTGCLQMQAKSMSLLNEYIPLWQKANRNRRFPWRFFNLQVGKVMEHHAVGVYPVGRAPEDGFVADSWIKQEPRFWTWKEWNDHYKYTLSAISRAKHEDGDPCFTHRGAKYIEAPGDCERTMTWGFCSIDGECQPVRSTAKACSGKCMCGTMAKLGYCKCVRPAPADHICVDTSPL